MFVISLDVDYLIYTGNDEAMCDNFKECMKQEFEMTDLGGMKFFLDVDVCQTSKEVLKIFGMEDCNVVTNPIVPGSKLSKDEDGRTVDVTLYKQMIGSLMYLTASRPDLMYSVCLTSRYMERPTETHMMAMKRIMRYVKGTISLGILYKGKRRLT